jgi:hypothetical protein
MIVMESGYTSQTPFNHARIAWDDRVETTSATSTSQGYYAEAPATWQTYERWRPSAATATLTAEFSESLIQCICVGAHTLPPEGRFEFDVRVNGEWEPILMQDIDGGFSMIANFDAQEYFVATAGWDGEALMVLIKDRMATGVRLRSLFWGSARPTVGKLFAGPVLEMIRPFYRGHSPIMLSRDSTIIPSMSESGEWIGNSLIRQGRSASFSWDNLPAPWYRANFDPLVEHLTRKPCFIAWNPLRFPGDVVLAASDGDISPTNSGPRDKMSVSVNFKGYRP